MIFTLAILYKSHSEIQGDRLVNVNYIKKWKNILHKSGVHLQFGQKDQTVDTIQLFI